jgi:uracil phosphoribosyltransferase
MGNALVYESAPTPDDLDEDTTIVTGDYPSDRMEQDIGRKRIKQPIEKVAAHSTIGKINANNNLILSPSKAYPTLFTKMRDVNTSSADFVKYSKRAMRLLAEDAIAEFPSPSLQINTPCGPFSGTQMMDPTQICAVSIIRSGDALLETVRECIPECSVGKILIQRDESHPDKPAKLYYSKMPPSIANQYVLLCDPMLATGGSAHIALDVLVVQYKVKPQRIIFANMICAPEGVDAIHKVYPKVKIVTACVDETLNAHKFIVPGLGDYGDRYFNTQE